MKNKITHSGDVPYYCQRCNHKSSNDKFSDNRLQFIVIAYGNDALVNFVCNECYQTYLAEFREKQRKDAKTKDTSE